MLAFDVKDTEPAILPEEETESHTVSATEWAGYSSSTMAFWRGHDGVGSYAHRASDDTRECYEIIVN